MKKNIYISFIFGVLQISLFAQNPVFRQINNLNGLPSNTVYDMLQDEKGFVWVAHDKGLSKYDGKTFVNYKNHAAQGKSLSNLMLSGNTIWCQDFSDNFYHTQNDSLVQVKRIKASGYFTLAGFSKNNELITIGNDSIRIFNTYSQTTKGVKFNNLSSGLLAKSNADFQVYNNSKFYDLNGNFLRNTSLQPHNNIFSIKNINGKMYGFTKDKYPYVHCLENEKQSLNVLRPGLFCQGIYLINDEVWICTSTGAYCFNLDFSPKYNGFCFFKGVSITSVLKDKEGSYWFGTINKGLFFSANLNVRLYTYEGSGMTALNINPKNGLLLLGTEKNELLQFNPDFTFSKKYSVGVNHEILGFYPTQKGIYVYSNTFFFLNSQYQKKWSMPLAVKALTDVNEQLYLAAFSGGACLMSKTNGTVPIPKWLQSNKNAWEDDKIRYALNEEVARGRSVAYNPQDSSVYAATSKGMFYFSPKGRGEILLNGQSVFASQIKVVDNQVFVSTFSNGILKILDKKAVSYLDTKDGLFSNTVYKFQVSGHQFWMIEDGMMQCFDAQNRVMTNYNHTDGLPKAEIKDILIDKEKVYLATSEGLVFFDKNLATQNTVAPNIVITGFQANGVLQHFSQQMTLSPSQNNIDIFFSVLGFKGENALNVKYKINDGEWLTMPQDDRTLSLTALASGMYHIDIQAFNEDGFYGKENIALVFMIATPWYKQWFTVVAAILTMIALFYFYFKRRIYLINKNNALVEDKLRLEQEVQKSMLASIKSQMNPHFLFNALNTIQSYIYTNDKENASIYLGKFSDLTRSILDMSNKETIPLSEEIKALRLYLDLEKLRFEDTLNYSITIDKQLDDEWVHIPSMLIQPYVENAIKHGLLHKKNDRKVDIRFEKEGKTLHISVEDNGIGRKRAAELKVLKNKQHESFALNANQKRLDILNYNNKNTIVMKITDKHDAAGIPTGTLIDIFIPI